LLGFPLLLCPCTDYYILPLACLYTIVHTVPMKSQATRIRHRKPYPLRFIASVFWSAVGISLIYVVIAGGLYLLEDLINYLQP
jgi:hypothetical protein